MLGLKLIKGAFEIQITCARKTLRSHQVAAGSGQMSFKRRLSIYIAPLLYEKYERTSTSNQPQVWFLTDKMQRLVFKFCLLTLFTLPIRAPLWKDNTLSPNQCVKNGFPVSLLAWSADHRLSFGVLVFLWALVGVHSPLSPDKNWGIPASEEILRSERFRLGYDMSNNADTLRPGWI